MIQRAARADAAVATLLCLLSLWWFTLAAFHGMELRDEGHVLRLSWLTAQGQVPHRDFSDLYGAGVFEVTGAALGAADGRMIGVRWALVALKVCFVLAVFGIARAFCGRGFASFAGVLAAAFWGRALFNLNSPYATLYTLPLLLFAFWLARRGIDRASARQLFFAGGAVGLAFLFKQSLAFYGGVGIGLAIWIGAWFAAPAASGSAPSRWPAVVWLVAGGAALLPVARLIEPVDYLVHFLALHVLVLAGAVALLRRGTALTLPELLRRWLVPYAAGGLAVIGAAVLGYASIGALAPAFDDLFLVPMDLINYHQSVGIPTAYAWLMTAGLVAAVTAGLLAVGGRARAALACAAAAAVVLALSAEFGPEEPPIEFESGVGWVFAPAQSWWQLFWRAPDALVPVQHALVVWAGIAAFVPWLAQASAAGERARRVFPLLVFEAFLCFSLFPRAAFNEWILTGAGIVLLVVAAERWGDLAGSAAPAARVAAALLVACVPAWLAAPAALSTWQQRAGSVDHQDVRFAAGRGLSMSEFQRDARSFDEFEELIAWFESAKPAHAPIVLLTNQELILFATGRPAAFPELETQFFLAGWGMLSPKRIAQVDVPERLDELAARAPLFVVEREDEQAASLRAAFPHWVDGVRARAREVARIGRYTVSRIDPPANPRARQAAE